MISPQHLINTGLCGLFCVTLFSLSSIKPQQAAPVALKQTTPIERDYTRVIQAGKDRPEYSSSRVFEGACLRATPRVVQTRTLDERNQHAREQRAQFEQLFTKPRNHTGASPDFSVSVSEPAELADDPAAILHRARNAVHRSIESGAQLSGQRR